MYVVSFDLIPPFFGGGIIFFVIFACMAFVTTSDLYISTDIQNKITAMKSDAFTIGIDYSDAYLKDRLIHLYDMDTVLGETGTNRNVTLLDIGVKIATYKAYKCTPQINTPKGVTDDYNEANEQLTIVEKRGLLTNLPIQEDEEKEKGVILYGGSDFNNIVY